MAQNSKVNGKSVNLNKINTGKMLPGTTRIGKDSITTMDMEGNISLDGEIIMPSKKIILDSAEKDSVIFDNLEKGLIENKKVDEYNDSLFETRDEIVDRIILIGPKLLVRMYRLKMYNTTGMWTGGRTQEVISESEMRKKKVQLSENMQYQDRAVVIQVSEGCSDGVKNTIKPGMVVDLDPVAFNPGRMQRWLHKDNVNNEFDNYFTIPEFIVENIVLPK